MKAYSPRYLAYVGGFGGWVVEVAWNLIRHQFPAVEISTSVLLTLETHHLAKLEGSSPHF